MDFQSSLHPSGKQNRKAMRKLLLPLGLTLLFSACNTTSQPSAFKAESGEKNLKAIPDGVSEKEQNAKGLAGGGYTYSWTPEHTNNEGSYTVNATDVNGCVSSYATTLAASGTASKPDVVSTPLPAPAKTQEMIIRTGNLRFSLEEYKKGRSQIEQIIKSHNGYIASENEDNTTYNITNTMTVRVLNKDFDALMNGLGTVAKQINTKTVNTQDVTAEYVDIQARLKTKKEIDAQYIELLKKAVKIADIIEIEDKERVIREEIEAKEGELRLLKDQVSYSTINLVFYQNFEFAPEAHPGFFHRTAAALGSGWISFLNFIVALCYAWPAWIIIAIGIAVVVKVVRRRKVV
jgi:hypothetical protein